MIQVKPQAQKPGVATAQTISSVVLPGLNFDGDPAHRAVRRFPAPFHVADVIFDIFGAQPVPANAAMMTFLDSCAAMALPPSREYLTR